MNRFQKLAALTLATALGLVTIGVIVRATDSGLGCPDWPLCHGQLIPSLDDAKAWIEWIHRTVAVIIGFEILGLALLAVLDHRDRRSILWPSFAAVGLVGFQAWLGRETVRLGNSGESVTAHLAAALALVGLLVFLTVRAGYPARIGGRGASQRFTLLAAFTTAATFALLLFGSHVTATASALVFPDWPLMNGTLLPAITDATSAHVLHRWAAAVVGVIVAALAVVAWRTQRDHPTLVRLAVGSAVLFAIQVAIGGAQVLTRLAEWTQTLHLALGAVIWAMLAGLTVTSYYTARVSAPAAASGSGEVAGTGADGPGGAADDRRHDPCLHRADEAPDHRAVAGHDGSRDGPRHARPARRHRRRRLARLGRSRLLDDDRRDAGGRQRQRDQLLSRSRHRPADDANPPSAAPGAPGRPGAGGPEVVQRSRACACTCASLR